MAMRRRRRETAPPAEAVADARGGPADPPDQAMDAEAAAILRDEATAYDVLGVDRGAEGLGDSAIR